MIVFNSYMQKNKRLFAGITASALFISLVCQASSTVIAADAVKAADASSGGLSIDAAAAIVVDANSGQILWAKNENEEREPASTTKLMTLYLAEQAIASGKVKKTDIVPISVKAYQLSQGDSSSGWLDPKEKIDLDTMIKLICVPSGNDAAEAVAEFLAGDETQFVKEMNDETKILGLQHTHYLDAHGLTEDMGHHTTAKDLATLARDLIQTYPDILQYTSLESVEVNDDFRKSQNLKPFLNTNRLLGKYEGMDGLKTGFTDQAGYCLVGTAKRDNMRLISVILGAKTESLRESETRKLLDYGFANFTEQTVVKKEEVAAKPASIDKGVSETIPAVAASDLVVALPKNASVPTKNVVYSHIVAPVKAGQKIGQLQLIQNGQVIAYTDLLAETNDDKASWIRLLFRGLSKGISSFFHKVL